MRCPSPTCGADNPTGQNFCDECGTQLLADVPHSVSANAQMPAVVHPNAPPCSECGAGAGAIDVDGFCVCGIMRIQPARNRVEVLLSSQLAGVCDVGCNPMHPENQDYLAAGAEGDVRAGVACDGVSRSQNSAAASELAAPACLNQLLEGVRKGAADTVALMRQAIALANEAVMSVPYSPQDPTDPAAATLAAALVQARKVTVGWVGDSRVYFIGETGSVHQLSVDHSYMAHLIESGMSVKEALAHEDAHAITHSLGGGGDSKYQEGSVKVFNAPGPGYILICTDGFWNYAPESKDVAAVFKDLPKNANAVQIAKALVEFARLRGGADNITVILIAIA